MSYDDWMADDSTLTSAQREILEGDAYLDRPLRIVGPAGSGKTLVMQLLASRILQDRRRGRQSVLYVTHNEKMRENVWTRFGVLNVADENLHGQLKVSTLVGYATEELNLKEHKLLDCDAQKAKDEQRAHIKEALTGAIANHPQKIAESETLSDLTKTARGLDVLVDLIRADISVAIKARALMNDRDAYVTSAESLGPLHAVLTPEERDFVYDVFERYQTTLEVYEVLDADDVALTMLGSLNSPQWRLDRKIRGFDFVLVDEAQLFNENERRVFGLLTKHSDPYTPVILALDEGQSLQTQKSSGLGLLGIRNVERTRLTVPHRMSQGVAKLAFYVVSQSVGLFDDDFPDYTRDFRPEGLHPGETPKIVRVRAGDTVAKTVVKQIRAFRRERVDKILVVCHADRDWDDLEEEFKQVIARDFIILEDRGQDVATAPIVLARPEVVGGQEYDAMISVGLELGVTPPRVHANPGLEDFLYQNAIKEMYLAFSRARTYVRVVIGVNAQPNEVLSRCVKNGFLQDTDPSNQPLPLPD